MKITGIKKIATQSKSLTGTYGPVHLHVLYDPSTGKAWASPLPANFRYDWDKLPKGVISCGDLWNPTKMAEIKQEIEYNVAAHEIYAKYIEQEDQRRYEEYLAYEVEHGCTPEEDWSSINA